MRVLSAAFAAIVTFLLVWTWWTGAHEPLLYWASEQQRETQTALARGLRELRAGAPDALVGFASLCFAYGFFHAIGPGHGKLVVGGYGLASRASAWRLSMIAVAGSLMQGAMAVALVFGGVTLLQATRDQITDTGEDFLAPLSMAAIGAIGLWLMVRGARRVRRLSVHRMDADGHCHSCGHAHGPDPEAVARSTGWRASLALVAGMGVRPCTGAVFVLILGWRMGIEAAAIVGTFAMALGTASVTVLVALGAVGMRAAALSSLGDSRTAHQIAAGIEIALGGLVAVIAAGLLLQFV